MGLVAFNTYEFIKSLKDAGIDEKHAAAISAGILKAHDSSDVATKGDLREMELRMTIKLGSMMIIAVGVLTAVIKLL